MEVSFYALFAGTYNEWPISQTVSVLLWNGRMIYFETSGRIVFNVPLTKVRSLANTCLADMWSPSSRKLYMYLDVLADLNWMSMNLSGKIIILI